MGIFEIFRNFSFFLSFLFLNFLIFLDFFNEIFFLLKKFSRFSEILISENFCIFLDIFRRSEMKFYFEKFSRFLKFYIILQFFFEIFSLFSSYFPDIFRRVKCNYLNSQPPGGALLIPYFITS